MILEVVNKLVASMKANMDGMSDNVERASWLDERMKENNVPQDIQEMFIKAFLAIYGN